MDRTGRSRVRCLLEELVGSLVGLINAKPVHIRLKEKKQIQSKEAEHMHRMHFLARLAISLNMHKKKDLKFLVVFRNSSANAKGFTQKRYQRILN